MKNRIQLWRMSVAKKMFGEEEIEAVYEFMASQKSNKLSCETHSEGESEGEPGKYLRRVLNV